MPRGLLNLLTALSLLLCGVTTASWVMSYRLGDSGGTLLAGQWGMKGWRGQLWVIRHRTNDDPSFVRTTVHLGFSDPHPVALIKAMVFDRNSPLDLKHGWPSELLSRPYVMVNLPDGLGMDNAWGFAAATGRLPPKVPALERYGSVLQAVAVPHWFIITLAAVGPAVWLRKQTALRRAVHRSRTGLCPVCGYDLRATTSRLCPECGAGIA